MAAAIATMLPVTLPRFVSASSAATSQSQQKQGIGNDGSTNGGQTHLAGENWGSLVTHPSQTATEGGPPDSNLDFDLLAEYLLDDGAAAGGLGAFDFSTDPPPPALQNASGVVSPDQEDSRFVDSLVGTADKAKATPQQPAPQAQDVNQIQTLLAAHASAIQQQQQQQQSAVAQPPTAAAPAAPVPAPAVAVPAFAVQPPAHQTASVPATAPAPQAPAPMTLVPAAPSPAQGVPVGAPAPVAMTAIAPGPGHQIIGMFQGAAPLQAPLAPMPAGVVAPPGIALQPLTAAFAAPGATPAPTTIPTVLAVQPASQPSVQDPTAKRRRTDGPTLPAPIAPPPIATAAPVAPIIALPGQIIQPQRMPQRGGRQKTQAQIDRRRERNRILARRTRLRKKFFFESLQKDVTDLQKENSVLKEIVRARLDPAVSKKILAECTANDELPSVVSEHCGEQSELDRQDFNLVRSIRQSQKCFVITDPSLTDNPIVYASDDFLTLTGYGREEVLGRNCRFLQGTETSPEKVAKLRKAVSMGEDCNVTMINYTADGVAFWNNLFIAALRDAQNNIVNFIGVVVKVAGPEAGDPEAGKKLPGEAAEDDQLMDEADEGDGKVEALTKAENGAEAEGTVMAIEGAVTAAVAAAPDVCA